MALTLQQKLKMNHHIHGLVGQEFRWGFNDCNLFLIKLFDYVNGTNRAERIENQYWDRRSAVEFHKRLGLTPSQWLHLNGFEKIEHDGEWQDGDVAIHQHKIYATAYVYFNRAVWTVPEGKSLTGYAPVALEPHITSYWRYNGKHG